jgi:hypothetical protein
MGHIFVPHSGYYLPPNMPVKGEHKSAGKYLAYRDEHEHRKGFHSMLFPPSSSSPKPVINVYIRKIKF